MAGERAGHQESTRAEKRRAGKPVVDEAAHLWIAAEIVSAHTGDSSRAHVLAGTGRVCATGRDVHAKDAQSADGDEYTNRHGAQRFEWNYGHGYGARDRRG